MKKSKKEIALSESRPEDSIVKAPMQETGKSPETEKESAEQESLGAAQQDAGSEHGTEAKLLALQKKLLGFKQRFSENSGQIDRLDKQTKEEFRKSLLDLEKQYGQSSGKGAEASRPVQTSSQSDDLSQMAVASNSRLDDNSRDKTSQKRKAPNEQVSKSNKQLKI